MELNFKVFGTGDPVIILHGLFGMLDNWQSFGKDLADNGFMVFLVDLPNHGRSPHTDTFTYSLMSDHLLDWMHSQGVYQSNIIGHSMGGKVAMQLALHNTATVDHLMVVDIAPRAYPPGHEAIIDALLSTDIAHASDRGEVEEVMMDKLDNIGVVRFLLKNLARNRDGGFHWKMNLALLADEYQEVTAAVESPHPFTGPAMFVRGGKSDYILDSDLTAIRQLFPNAQLQTIEGAGHWVHADAPEALLATTLHFLGKS